MQVLAVKAGSSGLKLHLLNARDQVVKTTDLPECGPATCHLGERGDQAWASSPDRAVSQNGGSGE
jgi:hypothetical protein